jgi:hypothetical protein
MKCSELILKLQEAISAHGDLEVGYLDLEFCDYAVAVEANVRQSNYNPLIYCSDAKELGPKFFGIGDKTLT